MSSQQVTPQGVTQIEVSAPIGAGMSGGPTVNRDNQVVGVNSAGLADQANYNFITDTPDLRTFLLSHNVALIQPPAPPQGGLGAMLYVIIGAIVLVLAVAVVLLMLIRRRRSPQFAAAGGAPVPGSPMQAPAPYPMPGPTAFPIQNPPPMPEQGPGFGGLATGTVGTASPPVQPEHHQMAPTPQDSADSAARTDTSPGLVSGGNGQPASGGTLAAGGTLASETTTTTGSSFCPSCGTAHRLEDHFCPAMRKARHLSASEDPDRRRAGG